MLNNEEWETLLFAIQQKNCILFLGPNISTLPNTPKTLLEAFSNTLVEWLKEKDKNYNIADPNDLAEVASLALASGLSYVRLQYLISNFYKQIENTLNPTLEFLAKLPFYLIINTTPDNLITNAYKKIGADFDFAYYDFTDKQERQDNGSAFNRNSSKPFIYNLFGSLQQTKSLVLTQKHQITFAKQIDTPEWAIPASIGRELVGDKIYLFVGFDFDTWYLRLLINALQKSNNNDTIPTSFALQKEGKILSPSAMVLFQKEFKLKFIESTAASFAQALNQQSQQPTPHHTTPSNPARQAIILHQSPQNDDIKNDFLTQIKLIQRKHNFELYNYTDAKLSTNPEQEMAQKLKKANIIFILATADLLATDNFFDIYLPIISDLNTPTHQPRPLIIPILAQACAWEAIQLDTYPTALPRNKMPIYLNNTANSNYWDNTIEQIDQIITNFAF